MMGGGLFQYESYCRRVLLEEADDSVQEKANHRTPRFKVAEGMLQVIGIIKAKRRKKEIRRVK